MHTHCAPGQHSGHPLIVRDPIVCIEVDLLQQPLDLHTLAIETFQEPYVLLGSLKDMRNCRVLQDGYH